MGLPEPSTPAWPERGALAVGKEHLDATVPQSLLGHTCCQLAHPVLFHPLSSQVSSQVTELHSRPLETLRDPADPLPPGTGARTEKTLPRHLFTLQPWVAQPMPHFFLSQHLHGYGVHVPKEQATAWPGLHCATPPPTPCLEHGTLQTPCWTHTGGAEGPRKPSCLPPLCLPPS